MPDLNDIDANDDHSDSGKAEESAGVSAPMIVAIGASAGGLTAFQAFFAAMPADSGMSFVLVQHLDPHYQSMLVEMLGRNIEMPVLQAEDGIATEANTVYVIPPDATLTISQGVLHVKRPAPPRLHRWPINSFFTSLAEDRGENAIGIILSGTGSDGASGVTAIKAHGGLTLAQSEYDHVAKSGMPESATATGYVDFVLRIEEMPARLLAYRKHMDGAAVHKDEDGVRPDVEEALPSIIALLHARLGHDFSNYKTSTVIRRIQRRMQVLGIDSMEAFTEHLRREPAQVEFLFRDMLIGVTQFMRDPEAFDALKLHGLPAIFAGKTNADQIRVWVPGCSTGEEVYSLAILLREAAEQAGLSPKVQIFGTDIDEEAIATARAALYEPSMKGMSAERIARWFTAEDDCYRVSHTIREMCIFSFHSLIKDPPFSRLDLISCRNLLIYMNSGLQEWVMSAFHYALRPEGVLFLGPSEGVTRSPSLFRPLNRKHRLYQKVAADKADKQAFTLEIPRDPLSPQLASPAPRHAVPGTDDRIDRAARAALERHSPAYLVVNDQYDILRYSGGETGRYLEPSAGEASFGLFVNLRKSLRPTVQTALQAAFASHKPVVQNQIPLEIDGQLRSVSVIVERITDPATGKYLCVVAFRDLQRVKPRSGKDTPKGGTAALEALEAELLTTKAQLQLALEAAETAAEDSRSSVEEYQSVNEELQSSNEELETAKEEMQSINEELQTINAELNIKNDQLVRLNSDVQNLLESTQIATVFLDSQMRIKGFTPAMQQLFHVRTSDYGRPLSDIAARLAYDDLWNDIGQVLRDHAPLEREVKLAGRATTFIMRIMPYDTGGNETDGIVLTFVNITDRKQTEQELREQAAIIEYAHDAFMLIGPDGIVRSLNPAAERLFGWPVEEAVGQPDSMFCPGDRLEEQDGLMQTARIGAMAGPVETVRCRRDGSLIEIELTIVPIPGESGAPVAFASASRDISSRIKADRHRSLLLHELSHRVKNALATVQSMAVQTLRGATSLTGFRDVFLARLIALANTHDLLTGADWEGAALRDVLETELKPYKPRDAKRWTISGPDIRLDPKSALALGMAFHELATNAAKFGALSLPSGRLVVLWEERLVEAARRLHFTWTEQEGPPVETPRHKGFGSRLITEGLAYELDGTVEVNFDPAGVCCVIDAPLPTMKDTT